MMEGIHRDIQVTYAAPGKRRRTITLARWEQHALRHMQQRLEDEHATDGRRERSRDAARPHGHTRDSENDATRVGVT